MALIRSGSSALPRAVNVSDAAIHTSTASCRKLVHNPELIDLIRNPARTTGLKWKKTGKPFYGVLSSKPRPPKEGYWTVIKRQINRGKPIRHDSDAVLKALASTYQPCLNNPPRGTFSDPHLTPRPNYLVSVLRSIEAGQDAAEFLYAKRKELFSIRHPEPAWKGLQLTFTDPNDSLRNLEYLIDKGKTESAITQYETLLKQGVEIPQSVCSRLIGATSYFGTISEEAEKAPIEGQDQVGPDETLAADDLATDAEQESKPRTAFSNRILPHSKTTWSTSFYAEKLFSQLKEKTAMDYEHIILGRVMFNDKKGAFSLFKEMVEKNMFGSPFLYNAMMADRICYLPTNRVFTEVLALFRIMLKGKVRPNPDTFELLLSAVRLHEGFVASDFLELWEKIKRLRCSNSLGVYLQMVDSLKSVGDARSIEFLQEAVQKLKAGELTGFWNDRYSTQHLKNLMATISFFRSWELNRTVMKTIRDMKIEKRLLFYDAYFHIQYLNILLKFDPDYEFVKSQVTMYSPLVLPMDQHLLMMYLSRINQAVDVSGFAELFDNLSMFTHLNTVSCMQIVQTAEALSTSEKASRLVLKKVDQLLNYVNENKIPVNATILGHVASIYLKNNLISETWTLISYLEKQSGLLNLSLLRSLLQHAISSKQDDIILRIVDLYQSAKVPLSSDMKQELLTLDCLSEEQKRIVIKIGEKSGELAIDLIKASSLNEQR